MPPPRSRVGHRAALVAAVLGWLFDGFEMGLFPLVGPLALADLLPPDGSVADRDAWFGVITAVFLVGAALGGVLFGWLGDRIGRVRAMSASILTYAVFTGACGLATEAWQIAALRSIASLGMGGEWALGVALVSELWPGGSRAVVAALVGAAANVGFLLVAAVSFGLVGLIDAAATGLASLGLPEATVAALVRGDGWRLLMMAGSLPALLVFFIRLFVPESPKWEAERAEGRAAHWAGRDLLAVAGGGAAALAVVAAWAPTGLDWSGPRLWLRLAITLAGFFLALGGFLVPVARYMARSQAAGMIEPAAASRILGRMLLAAALAGVPLLGTWGSIQWVVKWALALEREAVAAGATPTLYVKEMTQACGAAGAILGTVLAAFLCELVGRRPAYAWLCLASLVSVAWLYLGNARWGPGFLVAMLLANGATSSFYGWFPLAFPEWFPTAVRSSAQGFAFNFGRVIAAVGSLQTAALVVFFSAGLPADRIEAEGFPRAAICLSLVYLVGAAIIWLAPETRGQPLPDAVSSGITRLKDQRTGARRNGGRSAPD